MAARQKVLLYHPYCFDGFPRMPLPLMAVARMVDRERFEPVIIDASMERDAPDRLLREAANEPVLVGMSVMPGDQVGHAFEQSKRLKALYPRLPVVWGGYFPSLYPEICLKTAVVDVLVKGYGEDTFAELLEHFGRGGTLANLRGIAGTIHRRDGEVVVERKRPLRDLNQYPPLSYDLVDVGRYVAPTWHARRNMFYVSSQGCPYGCGFCAIPAVGGRKWSGYSPERVVEDVVFFAQHGADGVTFGDTEFFVSEERVRGIAEKLIEAGNPITWWAMGTIARLVHYQESTWELMERSRCAGIFVGAESGSDETLKVMRKPSTVADTLQLAEKFKKYRILPEFSFVLGYPPHPEQDIQASLELIRRLWELNRSSHFIPHVYTPLPDTENYELATANQFAGPTTLEGWLRPSWLDFGRMHHPATPWLNKHGPFLRDFETFIEYSNHVWADKSPGKVDRLSFLILKAACSLRWNTRFFRFPYELQFIWRGGRAVRRLVDGEIPLPGPRPSWQKWRWRRPRNGERSAGRAASAGPAATGPRAPTAAATARITPAAQNGTDDSSDGRRHLDLLE